jgi:hypothetical protein
MSQCLFCNKETPPGHNYCGYDCHVDHAKSLGGRVHCPNGLPINCIKYDNTMMEHEHADHPDYKFPVDVEYVGNLKGTGDPGEDLALYGRVLNDQEVREMMGQTHALIYTDGSIALTIYECCYAMWYLRDGEFAGGSLWKKGEWKLSCETIQRIVEQPRPT